MADIRAFGRRSVVARVDEGGQLVLQPVSAPPEQGSSPADEKYDVEASIGHGGMGEVLLVQEKDTWLAVQERVRGAPEHRGPDVGFRPARSVTT